MPKLGGCQTPEARRKISQARIGKFQSTPEKFWGHVDIRGPDDDWLWSASLDGGGYGHLSYQGKRWKASRLAWVLTHGEIPDGFCVCHKCDIPACCNPAHLFLGTQRDNVQDAINKGRGKRGAMRGSANGRAKLTEVDVALIRKRYAAGERQIVLASEFRVDQTTISGIVLGKNWK